MRIVVALGGNALLRRGEALTASNQLANVQQAAGQIARIVPGHELILTHGNGPQVGLLALQAAGQSADEGFPLDVLGAQTDGMIGYLLEQELGNRLQGQVVATLLTRIEVDPRDPGFVSPTKPIGPVYDPATGERVGRERNWVMAADGKGVRRVVPSPAPKRVLGLQPIRWLLSHGAVVIAAGGGGIPVAQDADGALHGVEAVIDKDLCSGLLARELEADCLIIATDVDAVYADFGQPTQRPLARATARELAQFHFPAGSMGPKVQAASTFVQATGRRAVIGSLAQIEAMLLGHAGTQVLPDPTA